MIEVRDLRKHYPVASGDPVVAVDGLSFVVKPGEVYGLLGANGAGKTTTLKMLATLIQPDGGRILVDGVDALKDPLGARARLAYVPAEAGLPPQLSPRETVRLYGAIQGVDDPAGRAVAILERLGAGSYLNTPNGDLSTGMKRRVVLARALIHEPQVLMLDEPTDGLDVLGRRDVLELVRAQALAGRTIIVSSHIMVEVERIVDRLGIVAKGRMAGTGTLEEILRDTGKSTLDDAFVHLAHPERAP